MTSLTKLAAKNLLVRWARRVFDAALLATLLGGLFYGLGWVASVVGHNWLFWILSTFYVLVAVVLAIVEGIRKEKERIVKRFAASVINS